MKYKICYLTDYSGACHKYMVEREDENILSLKPFFVNYRLDGSSYPCFGALPVKAYKEEVFDISEEEEI